MVSTKITMIRHATPVIPHVPAALDHLTMALALIAPKIWSSMMGLASPPEHVLLGNGKTFQCASGATKVAGHV